MKIAFVGMGSIGKRHIKNVCNYLNKEKIDYSIDLFRSGKGNPLDADVEKLIDNQLPYSYELTKEDWYDVVFVTNPTSMHYDTLSKFQNHGNAFFIEKPVFDRMDVEQEKVDKLNRGKCYVACPLRYNPVLEYVLNQMDLSNVISARAISSSYLPEWRPGTDYRKCYSAHTDMGGGVDIDLIHEWDYLVHLFGEVKEGFSIRSQISPLEIDSNDIAIYIAKTENTAIELHLDYFGRKSQRILELITKDDTIICDILNGEIKFLKEQRILTFESERNCFQEKEIAHFFDIVFGKIQNDSTIYHAMKVLKYAKGEF